MKIQKNKHVKVGDTIKVIAGNQKGFIGNITSIVNKDSLVFIEGILPRIKYVKNPQGGDPKKLELQIPIHISNVMLWNKEKNEGGRIGYKTVNNEKTRYFKTSGNVV